MSDLRQRSPVMFKQSAIRRMKAALRSGLVRSTPNRAPLGALAVGAMACGALAIGTLALGRLAIGRLFVGRARKSRTSLGWTQVCRSALKDEGDLVHGDGGSVGRHLRVGSPRNRGFAHRRNLWPGNGDLRMACSGRLCCASCDCISEKWRAKARPFSNEIEDL